MLDQLSKLLRPLRNQIANMVARAVVQLVDDSVKLQSLQLGILDEETREDVERFQNYGFTSVPLEGAEAVVVFAGGRRDHGLVLAVDDRRYRIKGLEGGEVAIYDDQGSKIVLKRGGHIEITPSGAGLLKLAGDTEAALKGTSYISAEATFLTALGSYALAIKPIADPTNAATPALSTAIATFSASGTAAKSLKVKVG